VEGRNAIRSEEILPVAFPDGEGRETITALAPYSSSGGGVEGFYPEMGQRERQSAALPLLGVESKPTYHSHQVHARSSPWPKRCFAGIKSTKTETSKGEGQQIDSP